MEEKSTGEGKTVEGVYPKGKNGFQIDKLPVTALRHLFKFLTHNDQRCMRCLCKGMRRFIEQEYGIHACLPSSWSLDMETSPVMGSLEGKVIRSLRMSEIYPGYNPFRFTSVIQIPWNLLDVHVEYVDIELVFTLLASCRNLMKLHYSTGLDRPITRPRPIPRQRRELMDFMMVYQPPNGSLQVEKLTFLSLHLEKNLAYDNSDWANVVAILLVLARNTIHSLKTVRIITVVLNGMCLKERLQIVACIGHFLGQCPNLKEFKYIDDIWSGCGERASRHMGNNMYPSGVQRPCLEPYILAGLIENYGSRLLQRTQELEALGDIEVLDLRIRDIMRDAGEKLKHLRKLHFQWCLERVMFECLLKESTSIRQCVIHDQSLKSFTHNGRYNWLLGQGHSSLFSKSLQMLCLLRVEGCKNVVIADDIENMSISLPKLLNSMSALKELQIVPKQPCRRRWKLEPEYYKYETRNDYIVPDISFGEEIQIKKFHPLEILKLEGVKISTLACARFIQMTNLRELVLSVIPEHRHFLFGIKSEDMLKLIGTLRKLEKVDVNMIQFPEEDLNLKTIQLDAFNRMGGLITQMHRYVGLLDQETVLMEQYKFTLF